MTEAENVLLNAARQILPKGYIIVPNAPTEQWIMALDDRHILNDQSSPGGGKLAQMIERVLATAPSFR